MVVGRFHEKLILAVVPFFMPSTHGRDLASEKIHHKNYIHPMTNDLIFNVGRTLDGVECRF